MSDADVEHWCAVITKAVLLGLIESDDPESPDLHHITQEKNS